MHIYIFTCIYIIVLLHRMIMITASYSYHIILYYIALLGTALVFTFLFFTVLLYFILFHFILLYFFSLAIYGSSLVSSHYFYFLFSVYKYRVFYTIIIENIQIHLMAISNIIVVEVVKRLNSHFNLNNFKF